MRQFFAFVAKEFRHIFRDRLTTAILLGLPILMLFLFGFAITTEVKNTRIAIWDPSRDDATRAITDRLAANDYFIMTGLLKSQDDIERVFERGEAGLVVAFSDNFRENMLHTGNAQVQLIADGSDPNTAKTLSYYATSIITAYQLEQMQAASVPYMITPEIRLLYNPSMKGAYNFVPGVMGMILLLVCAMMTSISIAREKETGTMEVLLVSPVRPLQIILAKTVPYFVISMIDLTTILLMSVYVLGVPIAGSLFWLVVLSLVYIFMALAMGILISSVANSQATALLISGMAMMLPVIMLSGMIFPLETMPRALQVLAQAVPAKWYIAAVRKVMIRGQDVGAIRTELTVLSGLALALIAVSMKAHRKRLE
jgi:ABC-2 type transport system permease protein